MSRISDICVDFDKTTMRYQASDQDTNETLTVIPADFRPFIYYYISQFYDQDSPTFRICGPLLVIVKEAAKFRRSWLKIMKPPESRPEAMEYMMNPELDMLASKIEGADYYKHNEQFKLWLGADMPHTRVIDYSDESYIAYKTYPGERQFLPYFKIIHQDIWLGIIFTTICISLIHSSKDNSVKNLSRYILDCIQTLFTKQMPRSFISVTLASFFIIGAWLLLAMSVSIDLCSFILDEKVKAILPIVLDSWDDLFDRPPEEVVVYENDLIIQLTDNLDTSRIRSFRSKIKLLEIDEFYHVNNLENIAKGLYSGKTALIRNRLTLIFNLITMSKMIEKEDMLGNLHVSRKGGQEMPYFMASTVKINDELMDDLNKIISWSTESGLYTRWKLAAIETLGYAGSFDSISDQEQYKFEIITMEKSDEYYILYIGFGISIFILVFEIIFEFVKRL